MGVGQIISDTFRIVKARFGPLLGLWAIYFAIMIGLVIVMGIGIGATGIAGLAAIESNPLAVGGGMILVMIVFYLGYLLAAMAQYASLIALASPVRQLTVGEALGTGLRAAPALLLLIIVLLVGYFVGAMILGLVGAAASTMGSAPQLLFGALLFGVVLWLGCRLAPLFAVIAVDGVRNPFTAITRSWSLTRGHALTIFLASLVFLVILIVACGIALLPSIGVLRTMADPAALTGGAATPAVGGLLLFGLGILVVSVLFNLCYCAFLAVIHGSLTGAAGEGAAEAFA
jgi:hypothetical protein